MGTGQGKGISLPSNAEFERELDFVPGPTSYKRAKNLLVRLGVLGTGTALLRYLIFRIHDPRRTTGELIMSACHTEPAAVRTIIVSRKNQQLIHPIPQMTTFELTELRRALEEALAMEALPRYARSREELQQQLSEAITEQDERARIRRANANA
jgi:hypothetical protein